MSELKFLIQNLAGTHKQVPAKTFDAKVISIDIPNRNCVVNSLDNNITNLTVRFMPEISDGDSSVPEVNSTVIVAMTHFTEPYIVKSGWLNQKTFVTGNQSFHMENDKQEFNDGKYGGIPIVKNPNDNTAGLLAKLNQLEQKYNDLYTEHEVVVKKINDLVDKFLSWIPVANDGGAALQTKLTVSLPIWTIPISDDLTPINPLTSEKDISNPNITHGDKFK